MRAVVLNEPYLPGRHAERDQVLAEEPDAHRWAVGLRQFGGDQRGDPVFADQIPHRRSTPDVTEELVVFSREHVCLLRASVTPPLSSSSKRISSRSRASRLESGSSSSNSSGFDTS